MAGRLKKVLKYGIGEVFLVTIGILLAIQINNWNDNRKSARELRNILEVISIDLESNIAEAEDLQKVLQVKSSYLSTIFDTAVSRDSLYKSPMSFASNTSFRDLTIRKRGLNLLRNFKSDNNVTSDSLLISIEAFYGIYSRNNQMISDIINSDVIGTLNYYRDNFEWYERFVSAEITPSMIDDILTNTTTRNRLLHHKVLIDANYSVFLHSFATEGKQYLKDLKDRLDVD